MPFYDFGPCAEHGPWEDFFAMSELPREAPCPECGKLCGQALAGKAPHGRLAPGWSDGRFIPGLLPGHPDHMVTSPNEMHSAYERNGIDPETGKFKNQQAKLSAYKKALTNRKKGLKILKKRREK